MVIVKVIVIVIAIQACRNSEFTHKVSSARVSDGVLGMF